ncbi:MAG: flavodoxin family protein [Sphingobacteriales bacterium]|nr:MAG: flavodoxin family protein [Sphingobacteriales bacterium]
MDKIRIAVVYHSGSGHTRTVAKHLATAMQHPHSEINLLSIDEDDIMEKLHEADTIVFGCPTYFGNESAAFKSFMEKTGTFWYRQLWKDKLAAAFTTSSTTNGDKLNTLVSLALFAAQHSMIWISQGILPRYINDQQTDGQNRMGSFLGLMTQTDNSIREVSALHPGDSLTIELFGRRILDITQAFKGNAAYAVALPQTKKI